MVKTITRIALVLLLAWAVWLGYQYHTKSQSAFTLAEKKIEEFYADDLNTLLQKIGKGYELETIEIDGKKFWVSRSFEKIDENTLVMKGRVDFVELLPFSGFRFGYILKPTLRLK
jgi:hypothetical protein